MDKYKQDVIDLLMTYNRPDLADDLYDPNLNIEDWAERPDVHRLYTQIPGLIEAVDKIKGPKLPHNLADFELDAMTEGDPDAIRRYKKEEEELKKNIDEKNKLAEEYKRAAAWSLKLPSEFPIVGGSELSNPYAAKHYAKGETKQAVANEIAGKVAGALDYIPVFSLAGPAIRSTQKWAADEELDRNDALDWGLGALGFAKKIPGVRNAAKKVVDTVAGLGNKSLGSGTSSAASKELLKGKGKIIKDFLDNDIAYGTGRKAALPDRSSMSDIPTEKDYTKAVEYVKEKYKDDWRFGLNIPHTYDSELVKDAFKIWNEENSVK